MITTAIATVLALTRIYIGFNPQSELFENLFKDTAHIFIGYIFTRWWFDRIYNGCSGPYIKDRKENSWLLWTGITLTVVEVLVAIGSRI